MVAHVLRLRIAVLLGALRGDRSQTIRVALASALLVAAAVAAAVALLGLSAGSHDSAAVVTVLAGAVVTLGFAAAPLITGAHDPMDPRRFRPLGLEPAPLSGALALAGLLSFPSLVLAVPAGASAAMWIERGAPPALAVLSAVLGVSTCVLLVRVSMAIAALTTRERRSREMLGISLLGLLVAVVPVGVFLSSLPWSGEVPSALLEATHLLAYTPLGAAWALPASVASSGPSTWLVALVAVATVVALAAAWMSLVIRMLTTIERPVAVQERGGLGWFAVTPGTPVGAVAARSLVYWLSDRRYLVNVAVIPVAAAITVVPMLVAGVPVAIIALVPVPLMALFFGWLPHNDLAYDSTAIWMHLAGGIRGAADRVGRLVPILLIGVPVLAIAIPVAISVHGRWALLPAMIGVCASLFLSGLGLSSIASVVAPYAVSQPGDSPFQQPQRVGAAGGMAQGLVLVGALLLSAPPLWWGWLALTHDVAYTMAAFWGGLGTGLLVLVIGITIGAAVFDRSGSRLMEFAESA